MLGILSSSLCNESNDVKSPEHAKLCTAWTDLLCVGGVAKTSTNEMCKKVKEYRMISKTRMWQFVQESQNMKIKR